MKAVKDYITEKLISTGFNPKNIFAFEQMDKSQLFKNTDSAEFLKGRGATKKSVKGYGSSLDSTGTKIVTAKQSLERQFTQDLRLLMKKETLEGRLNNFYASLYTLDSEPDAIARIEVPFTGYTSYYDILSVDEQLGKESKIGVVEVVLSFKIRAGTVQETETLTINDMPITVTAIE